MQNVNLFGGIVEGYRSTDGAWNAEVLHNWLGAVGACAHGNAHFVEKGANVERVGESVTNETSEARFSAVPISRKSLIDWILSLR